ncbi:MAG: polysaccharide biosynthesis protein [Bacteroidota bacterium]|nr:polysaccharide biosynthesis protein [Bacteroidota bacterium]
MFSKQTNFNLDNFITTYVTKRPNSLLADDFHKYNTELNNRINNKSVLVIGGAGTIGSSYIKAILRFNIAKLVVVDINENGLTELVRDLRSSTEYHIPEEFITYPVTFEDRDMIPFDQIALDLLHELDLEPDICQTEDEAREKAMRLYKPSLREGSTTTFENLPAQL